MLRELALLFSVEGAQHPDENEGKRLLDIGDELDDRAREIEGLEDDEPEPDTVRLPVIPLATLAFKTCACCGVGLTEAQWSALPVVGRMTPGRGYPDLELRNHGCGSTLAVERRVA
jgi:hypothetical protein